MSAPPLHARIVKVLPGERLYVAGQALVQALSGQLAVLGLVLSPEDEPQRLVSPPSMSLLFIESYGGVDATVQLRSFHDGLESFSMPPGSPLLQTLEPGATFAAFANPVNIPQGCTLTEIPKEWRQLVAEVLTPPDGQMREGAATVAVVCGPRKVGKSTFTRFLVNNLLSKHATVAVLDLDIGQSEFFPPGFMALQLVHNASSPIALDACGPLLGPPFSHSPAVPTHSRFLGIIAADKSAALYLSAAAELFEVYRTRYLTQGIPLVINTMGWVDGLGFALLQSVVHNIRPTHMLAIRPSSDDRSTGTGDAGVPAVSPAAIAAASAASTDPTVTQVPEYVMEAVFGSAAEGVPYGGRQPLTEDEPVYIAAVRSGIAPTARLASRSPAVHRTALLMAYFHRVGPTQFMLEPSLAHQVPYCLPWSSAIVFCAPSRDHIVIDNVVPALPLSIVGLASSAPLLRSSLKFSVRGGLRIHRGLLHNPSPECRGAAIIRAVDPVQKVFHILTPIPLAVLHAEGLSTIVFRAGFLCPRSLFSEAFPNVPQPGDVPDDSAPYRSVPGAYSSSVLPNARHLRPNLIRKAPSQGDAGGR